MRARAVERHGGRIWVTRTPREPDVPTHVLAIVQTNVSYMIAVKRTSLLFGLAYGAWWFGEREMALRLAGTLVMLIGVALMVAA